MQFRKTLGVVALLAAGAAIPVIAQNAGERDGQRPPPPPSDQRGPQNDRGPGGDRGPGNSGGPRDERRDDRGPRDDRGGPGGPRDQRGPGGDRGPGPGSPGGPQRFAMPMRMEKAAYLGVVTSPADATLQEQLGLPRGVGLVVEMVDKDGPASAAGLKQHDVLQKLNDQLLINGPQLSVLVRTFKPGESVEFTAIRAGKPTKLTAKLVEKEMPVLSHEGPGAGGQFNMPVPPPMGQGGPPDVDTLIFRGAPAPTMTADYLEIHDGKKKISLTNKDGKRTLKATDTDNKVIFEGPVNTPEEIAKVPEDLRKWIGNVQRMVDRRPPGSGPTPKGGPGMDDRGPREDRGGRDDRQPRDDRGPRDERGGREAPPPPPGPQGQTMQ